MVAVSIPNNRITGLISPQHAVENALATFYGLDRYDLLMSLSADVATDVSAHGEFQRLFNGLYRVRRSQSWQEAFYRIFQDARIGVERDFATLLRRVHNETGRVETSFVSKMLATLDDRMPLWDAHVVRLLNRSSCVRLPLLSTYANRADRLQAAEQGYGALCSFYTRFMDTDEGQAHITQFDALLPRYAHISNVRKIDCLLWGSWNSGIQLKGE